MAIREGKKIIRTLVHVFDEMLFGNSVDKSNMPQFITNPPPTQDNIVEAAAVGNQLADAQPIPVIAELPTADNVIEDPRYEVGGGGRYLEYWSLASWNLEWRWATPQKRLPYLHHHTSPKRNRYSERTRPTIRP